MTIYAKAPAQVPVPYLTPGKEYRVSYEDGYDGFYANSDRDKEFYGLWKGCAHLDMRDWERIERDDEQ